MTSSYYHGDLSPPTKSGFTTEMDNLPSPDPSYNRPFYSPQQPLNPQSHTPTTTVPPTPNPEDGMFSRLARAKFEKLKRRIRMLQIAARGVSTLFSIVMFAIMIYANVKHYTTKGTIRNGRDPWPLHGTKVWPALMLLAASGFTLVVSLGILFSYCCCFKKAWASWKLTVAQYAVHIMGWLVVAILYRYEKSLHGDNDDLWGWSCSTKANDIQAAFNGVVNFKSLCRVQVSSRCYSGGSECSL